MFFCHFYTAKNLCDFLFVSLDGKALSKWGLFFQGKNLFLNSIPNEMIPIEKCGKKEKMADLFPLKSIYLKS